MKRIRIVSKKYGTKYALVDDVDYSKVNSIKWCLKADLNAKNKPSTFYAHRSFWENGVCKSVMLHRFILRFPKNHIDHIDGNGLNCQKYNLRVATVSQNKSNGKLYINNTTGFKGVHKTITIKPTGKIYTYYRARIAFHGKRIHGGCFHSAIDAAKKYNELAIQHFGEFARLNPV